MKRENRLKIGGFSVFGGETGIRTPDTVVAVYTISNRAPSTSSDISPTVNVDIIPTFFQKIKAFFYRLTHICINHTLISANRVL